MKPPMDFPESPCQEGNFNESPLRWPQQPLEDNAVKYVRCPNCRYSFVCYEPQSNHKCVDITHHLVKLPPQTTLPAITTGNLSLVSTMRENPIERERPRLPALKAPHEQEIEISNITSFSAVYSGSHKERRDGDPKNETSLAIKLPPIELNNRVTKNIIRDDPVAELPEESIITYDYQTEETQQPSTALKLPDIRENNGWGRHFNHYTHWNQGSSQPPSADQSTETQAGSSQSEESTCGATKSPPPLINLRQIYMENHKQRYSQAEAEKLTETNKKRLPVHTLPTLPLQPLPPLPRKTDPCGVNEQILSRLGLTYLPNINGKNGNNGVFYGNDNNNNISKSNSIPGCELPIIKIPVPPVKKFVVTKPRIHYRDESPSAMKLQQQLKQRQEALVKSPEEMLRFKALVDIMKKAVKKMDSSYWEECVSGLQDTVRVSEVDPAAVEPFLKYVNRAQIKTLRSLRPCVVRDACVATKQLFRTMQCTLRPEFDEIANYLIQKTADLNLSVRRDANDALDSMVTFLAPFHCVRVITRAAGHRNPLVRSAVARLITCVVVIMSPDTLLGPRANKDVRKRVMCMIAELINDQCLATRKQTRDLYKILMTHEDFEMVFQQDVDVTVYEKLETTLLQLKYQLQQEES